jgi:hypothetical protein
VFSVREEHVRLYACPVPCCFYKKKPWQPVQLDEAMEQAFSQVEGMADTVLSAEVRVLLGEDMSHKWEPRPDTLKTLTALRLAWDVRRLAERDRFPENQGVCLEKHHERRNNYPAKAVIYLGAAQDEDWQLQMAWELLQPYLPKLNHCVVRQETAAGEPEIFLKACSRGEAESFAEADGCTEEDSRGESISAFAQACAYEYGLVVQTERYGEKAKGLQPADGQAGVPCLHLDFRGENLYHSAVKYLDTIVKNSYYE